MEKLRISVLKGAILLGLCLDIGYAGAEAMAGSYGLKIYRVNSGFYPYVEVYFRTFDQQQQSLINLNESNLGIMVKGRTYDPSKRQYGIQTLGQRQEATRTVLVMDASKSMVGAPFEAALKAAARFIDTKQPQDEIAILAIRDTKEGYEIVSEFERDFGSLARRLADVKADGLKTRLYDSIGAAMQMCALTSQGSINPDVRNQVVSCAIVVFSDGYDEGSAVSREELNGRITQLPIPIPVYSLAYAKAATEHFQNLEAISKNSFGMYYLVGETLDKMQKIVEEISNIAKNDYVVTFRAYVPVDGEKHPLKLGIEYPAGSGKFTYDDGHFEAIEPPPLPGLAERLGELSQALPGLADKNDPYLERPQAKPAAVSN